MVSIQQDDRPPSVILVADDSEADRDIIQRAIEDSGVNCIFKEVKDGELLLKYLQQQPPYDDALAYPWPDLLLLDINMPHLNGKEALQQLRKLPRGDLLPVVIFTGSREQSQTELRETYRLGANAFITKPFGYQDFVHAITEAVSFWLKVVTRQDPEQP